MNRSEISEALRSFLLESFPQPGIELTESTELLDEWFVDSMGIVQTVIFLEEQFGCDVEPADINVTNFASIASLSAFVADHLAQD